MTYLTKTAARQNAPAYYATIEGLTGIKFATHPILSGTGTIKVCMDVPFGNAQSLAPLNKKATIGELRIRLSDVAAYITDVVSTEKPTPLLSTLINRNVTVYGGYRDEPESEYLPMFSGEIREVKLVDPLVYELTIAERKRRYEENLMASLTSGAVITELYQAALQFATQIKVLTTIGFSPGQTYLLYRKDGSQFERVTISTIDAPNNLINFSTPLANSWRTLTDVLTNAPFVRGNIVNIFYSLLRGVFSLGPSSFPLLYKSGTLGGLTFAATEIDEASLISVRDKYLSNFTLDFLWDQPISARRFFEEELYPLGFWPTVNGQGQVGIRAFIPAGPVAATLTKVYKEHMDSFPEWERRIDEHINRVQVWGDLQLNSGQPDTSLALEQSTSDQTATKETILYEIRSSGLRTALDGVSLAREVAFRTLGRYKVPPIQIRVPLIFTKRGLQTGDMVQVSHDALPNVKAGTIGLTDSIFEVVEVNPDYAQGLIEVRLIDTSFRKYAYLGPTSMADYGAASATEKLYAYWGDASNQVGAGAVDGYWSF